MDREIDINEYLPLYLREYKELKYINNVFNTELSFLTEETEIIFKNLFIITCTILGIERFESMLDIIPESDDTLESRRARILYRWMNGLPYTIKRLMEMLDNICGAGNYTIIKNYTSFEIYFVVMLTAPNQIKELRNMLYYTLPANLIWEVTNKITLESNGNIYTAGAVNKYYKINMST